MGENLRNLVPEMGMNFVPKTISGILAQVSAMDDISTKLSTLDFYVTLIQEEMRKIDAFKRELPHCMYFLKEGIERLVEERQQLKAREKRPVMEEFIPLKNDPKVAGGAKRSFEVLEKNNWLSSAQLWSNPFQFGHAFHPINHHSASLLPSTYEVGEGSGSGKTFLGLNLENRGGAFVPFKKLCLETIDEEKKFPPVSQGLSLSFLVDEIDPFDDDLKDPYRYELQQPHQRKQRRCWSPDLHSRFIEALEQLGGPQATPKQIRDVMNVEGLTNDEVKSHLQKYRIHVRRFKGFSSPVTVDYSWMAQDENLEGFTRPTSVLSGSPEGPLVHGDLSMKAGTSGESMEEDEDDKSKSDSKDRD